MRKLGLISKTLLSTLLGTMLLGSISNLALADDTDQSHNVTGVEVEAFGVTLNKPYKDYKYDLSTQFQSFVPETGNIGIFDDFSIELNYDNTVKTIRAFNIEGEYPNNLSCGDVFYNIEDSLKSKYGNKIRKGVGFKTKLGNDDFTAIFLSKEFNIFSMCTGQKITLIFKTEKEYLGKPPYKKIESNLGI